MPTANTAALDFLLNRRSRPAKTLVAPAPTRGELAPILTAAARSPDHGMTVPFRFIVVEKTAMGRLSQMVEQAGARLGKSETDITKARSQFDQGQLAVAVVEVQQDTPKIPAIEMTYAAGAVCLSLLNAALASGWGANWLSGWHSHDPQFCQEAFDLAENERIAGLIYLGTQSHIPSERPRPDVAAITRWITT